MRRELPGDSEVAESLERAKTALSQESKSLGFNNEVEAVSSLDKFKNSVSLPGKSLNTEDQIEILLYLSCSKLKHGFFRCLCVSFQIIIKPTMRRDLSLRQHFMPPVSISTFLHGKDQSQFLFKLFYVLQCSNQENELLLGGCGGELGVGQGREYQESSNV